MENYKVLQRLGKGAQGAVHLVENRSDGKKYVMKKVECNDESEANKAFSEAMALHDLAHPYICGYKEFFVTWDKEECAMFVCIVMEHYKHGDLSLVLRKQRNKQEPLDELIVKKWLGQIIEALVFVHKRKVIHRDLKPSNIFLMEDMSICLGDFGVATIMGDARTRTRTTVGSMNWMAPEVLERPYDERSDVWSVGCILLEMVTCSIYDSGQMSGKLFEIKHSQEALEEMLEEVGKTYPADVVSVIRTMLRRNFSQRPTAEQLVEIPYVRTCLALSGSVLAERKKRQSSAPPQGVLPKDRGMMPVVEHLRENIANEAAVKQSLEYLATISKEEGSSLDSTSKRIIVRAMRDYISEVDVQIAGCNLLNNLLITASNDDVMYSAEAISVVPLAMKSHPGSSELQQAAASLLMALSADDGASEVIGSVGGLQDILSAMRSFPDNVQLCTTCCNALWSLTVNEDNARIMTEEKGLRDIVKAIRTHFRHAELVEAGCATLMSLSIVDDNLEQMNDLDCAGLIVDAMNQHVKDPKVIKNGCMALASLVEPDEESAFRVLMRRGEDGAEIAGIPIIVAAYEQHKDNAEVMEAMATLIMELTEYEELCREMHQYKVERILNQIQKKFRSEKDTISQRLTDEILAELKFLRIHETVLHEMHKRFKDNREIMTPVDAALSKMSTVKKAK